MTRKTGLLAWILLSACATSTPPAAPVAGGNAVASVDVFYGALAPYGEWVYVGGFGRVWRPSVAVVGAGFRPYGSGGHWVYTDYGWSFESDWSWGWAPFHYGRWHLDGGYGWVWVPGAVWAPAWVSWRYGGGYVGWAPLPPAGSAIVIDTYHPYWCFVETRYLVVRDVYHYAMPVQSYHAAFSATIPVQHNVSYGGARWSGGPPAGQVSREIGQPIRAAVLNPPPPGAVQAHRVTTGAAAQAPVGVPHPAGPPPAANPPHPASPPPAGSAHLGASAGPHPSEATRPEGEPVAAHSPEALQHSTPAKVERTEVSPAAGRPEIAAERAAAAERGRVTKPPPPPLKKKRR